MRKLAWVVSAILLAAAGSPAAQDGVTLVTASRIHTMDTARPMATAMAYGADGRILAVGQADALAKQYPRARRVDVGNAATSLPASGSETPSAPISRPWTAPRT